MNDRELLKALEAEVSKLNKRISDLKESIRKEDSEAFIKANHIKVDDIHRSATEHNDGQYFNSVWDFADHVKSLPRQKRFIEWNTQIHFTSDILSGKWSGTPSTLRDVERVNS